MHDPKYFDMVEKAVLFVVLLIVCITVCYTIAIFIFNALHYNHMMHGISYPHVVMCMGTPFAQNFLTAAHHINPEQYIE